MKPSPVNAVYTYVNASDVPQMSVPRFCALKNVPSTELAEAPGPICTVVHAGVGSKASCENLAVAVVPST